VIIVTLVEANAAPAETERSSVAEMRDEEL
jgi:hypothetical protein